MKVVHAIKSPTGNDSYWALFDSWYVGIIPGAILSSPVGRMKVLSIPFVCGGEPATNAEIQTDIPIDEFIKVEFELL